LTKRNKRKDTEKRRKKGTKKEKTKRNKGTKPVKKEKKNGANESQQKERAQMSVLRQGKTDLLKQKKMNRGQNGDGTKPGKGERK